MKRRCFPFLLILVLLVLNACDGLVPSIHTPITSGDVAIETQFSVYSCDIEQINVFIRNNSSASVEYGAEWEMETYRNGVWVKIPFVDNVVWIQPLYSLGAGGTSSFTVHLGILDYAFSDGEYRIVKELNDTVYAAEFSMGQSRVSADSPYGFSALEQLPEDYTAEQAAEDGVIFPDALTEEGIAALDDFFAAVSAGMRAQIRLARVEENGLYLVDIIAERVLSSLQLICRIDDSRIGGEGISEQVYGGFWTDGEMIALSNRLTADDEEVDFVEAPLLQACSWQGRAEVIESIAAACKANREWSNRTAAYWSPDRMKLITLTQTPMEFGLSQLYADGGESGSLLSLPTDLPVCAIRDVVWTADSETVMFICATDCCDDETAAGMTGYVFYSIGEHQVTGYTVSPYGYTITDDGKIVIPE